MNTSTHTGKNISSADAHFEDNMIYKAAWYYYMEGLTQQAIANKLNISRIKVLRLLERARQEGIVQISLNPQYAEFFPLEQAIVSKYGLKDCYVVPSSSTRESNVDSITKAAAIYVHNHITENCYLNFGFGEAVIKTLNHLSKVISSTISLVSLTGGITNYLPNGRSNFFNANLHLFPAPLIMSSPDLAQAMINEPSLLEISRMTRLANMTIIGIGGMNEDSTILKSSFLTQNDYLLLKMQGAVGDLITHFIDKDGNLVNPELDSRIISTPLSVLRDLDNVVGIAAGSEKIPAIDASLKSSYIDILITDDTTAQKIIKY